MNDEQRIRKANSICFAHARNCTNQQVRNKVFRIRLPQDDPSGRTKCLPLVVAWCSFFLPWRPQTRLPRRKAKEELPGADCCSCGTDCRPLICFFSIHRMLKMAKYATANQPLSGFESYKKCQTEKHRFTVLFCLARPEGFPSAAAHDAFHRGEKLKRNCPGRASLRCRLGGRPLICFLNIRRDVQNGELRRRRSTPFGVRILQKMPNRKAPFCGASLFGAP